MYKILCDNKMMYSSDVEELALINPVVELEENCAGSFSFTIPPIHPFYDLILKRKSVIQVYQDNELIFSGMAIEVEVDFYKQKYVYCEGELAYLNDSIQRPARYQNITVRGLLEAYINSHNAQVEEEKQFTVGMVTVTDPNDSLYCYSNMESTMQCLKEDLCDDLGGYFRIRHADGVKYIDYLADSMNTCNQVIRLGENLIDFTSNINSTDIATAIIPLGEKLEESPVEGLEVRLDIKSVNNGLDYVCSQTAIANYGWIYKTVEWDNVTTAAALKSKGEQYLSDIQFENMIIEAKAIDLHFVDSAEQRFKLSDKIRVVSAPHGLDRYFRLTKQTINLNNPENDEITLGKEERLSLSAKTSQANAEILKAMESITPASTILKQAKDNATALITSAMGGYVVMNDTDDDGHPDEILIMDTDSKETATKVWRWNANGLGYSSTGYNGEYGLAMTMNGAIVADFITSGTVAADRIKNSVISAINGQNLKIEAKNLDINGAVSFSDFDIGTQTTINNKLVSDDLNGYTKDANLANGTTTIKGQCISTGAIKSNNYKYTSGSFTDEGMYISLTNGNMYTPSFSFFSEQKKAYFKGDISASAMSSSAITSSTIKSSVLESSNYKRTTTDYYSEQGISIDLDNANIITPTFAVWKNHGTHIKGNLDSGSIGGLEIYNSSDNQHGFQYNQNNYFFRVGTKDITCGCAYGSGWCRLDWIPEWGMLRVDYGDANSSSKGIVVTNVGNNNKADNGSNYIQIKNTQIYRHRSDWGISYPVWTGNDDTSDINAKTNVTDIPKEDVKYIYEHLRPIHFNYKEELDIRGEHFGVIAQDMEKILSDLGYTENVIVDHTEEDGYMRLHYYETIGLQIAGIKYLYEEVDALKEEIEALKQEIKSLKGDK